MSDVSTKKNKSKEKEEKRNLGMIGKMWGGKKKKEKKKDYRAAPGKKANFQLRRPGRKKS